MFYLIGCFLKKTVMYLAPLLLCITAASLSGGDGDGPSADKASGLTVEVPGSLTDPEYTYSFVDYEKLFALWRESIEKDLDNGRNLGGDNEALEYLQRYADKHTEFLFEDTAERQRPHAICGHVLLPCAAGYSMLHSSREEVQFLFFIGRQFTIFS